MGTSVLPYRYRINGLVDTSKPAINNLELIGNSCATWITYDVQDGKWAVVINRSGTPVHAFDDNNIIGAIKLSGTGLTDQYNGVEVRFPHRDLNDQTDWVRIEIPTQDRLPGEPDNVLTMDIPMINEPVQAQIIGLIELKQARLDKIITFQSDYSKINLAAGEIVSVTNSVYGWTNKLFRVIRMEETDVSGAIVIDITALEYDASIYDLSDLYRYTRTNQDGILTQGALGTPSTPAVTKFESDANPRVEIASSTPDNTDPLNQTGIVEAMEFWISTNGTDYTLLATKKPESELTFAANTTVTFSYNNIGTDFYVKTRCVNSTTTGEFSSPASVLFDATQVTDALGQNTGILDSNGSYLPLLLALPNLLKGLDTFMGGNANAFGQVTKNNQIVLSVNSATVVSQLNAQAAGYTTNNGYDLSNIVNRNNWIAANFTIGSGLSFLDLDIKTPLIEYEYEFEDRTGTVRTQNIAAQPPLAITLLYGTSLATASFVTQSSTDWNANYTKIISFEPAAGTYWITARLLPTYDLDMYWVRSGLTTGEYNNILPINFVNSGFGNFDVVVNASTVG